MNIYIIKWINELLLRIKQKRKSQKKWHNKLLNKLNKFKN